MDISTRDGLITYYFEIAGLQLEVAFPATVDVDAVLPSFRDFRRSESKGESIAVARFLNEEVPSDDNLGELRSDISIVWGDNFRFYEQEDAFVTVIKHEQRECRWMMRSTKDFRKSEIYGNLNDPHRGDLLAWLLMVVFGQVGLHHRLILIHASVVAVGKTEGVAFLGNSGTGKSTHSRLWLQHIPNTELLNDDNPAVRIEEDGHVRIYGTPWSGKTPCYKDESMLLKGFVRLQQAPFNRFTPKKGMESLIAVLPSCTALRWNKDLFNAMTDTLTLLVEKVPVGQMECLPDAAAAQLSYKSVFASN